MLPQLKIPTKARDSSSGVVARCQHGDHAAFRELFERHHERVYATVYHLVSRKDELDDVVQKVFLEVYRSVHRFEGRALFTTWLTRVAIHVARAHERKLRLFERNRKVATDAELEGLTLVKGGMSEAPDRCLMVEERARAARALISKLPDKKRTVLILAEFQEMTAPEIADVLGIPAATVRTRLYYARREFEELARKHPAFRDLDTAGGET